MDALTFFPNEVVTQQTSSIFQSKKVDVEPERVCTQCGSTDTPLWRRGPHGPKSMCNRCGIRWKRKEDKKAGKKPNSNKKKKESTPKAKKIRTSSDREFLSSSSLSPTHDSDSWLSELDDEEETDFNPSVLSARAKVTMGSETSEPMYTDHKEPHLTVNLTPQGESFTVDDGLFARPEVPEPRRLSRDFININSSINYRNDTEPHDGMSLRKRKAKPRSTDFDYEWNALSTSSPARRKSRQESIDEQLRNLPNHTRMFLEQAEAELNRIRKEEKENAEIVRLNQLLQQVQSENNELRQQNMQKDAVVSSLQEQLHKAQQHAQAVAMFPGFRPFPGMYTNAIQLLPHEIQRVNLLPQSMH